jgi:hypothetical protein
MRGGCLMVSLAAGRSGPKRKSPVCRRISPGWISWRTVGCWICRERKDQRLSSEPGSVSAVQGALEVAEHVDDDVRGSTAAAAAVDRDPAFGLASRHDRRVGHRLARGPVDVGTVGNRRGLREEGEETAVPVAVRYPTGTGPEPADAGSARDRRSSGARKADDRAGYEQAYALIQSEIPPCGKAWAARACGAKIPRGLMPPAHFNSMVPSQFRAGDRRF